MAYNVLFLCTGNSARSILAEAILNAEGKGRFKAFSAGSHPSGKVNSFSIELLEQRRYPTDGLRSKVPRPCGLGPGKRDKVLRFHTKRRSK